MKDNLGGRGGLINFLPRKRGVLIEGGGLFETGEGLINREFMVLSIPNFAPVYVKIPTPALK